jgi:hypothetical protein
LQHRPGRHLPREQGVCARAHVGRCADMSYVALCESARAVRQHHNVIVFRNTCDTTVFMCEKWWVSVTDHRMVEVARLGLGSCPRQVDSYPCIRRVEPVADSAPRLDDCNLDGGPCLCACAQWR